MSAESGAADAWLRARAKPRGRIDPEVPDRELTPSERMGGAVRNAARRARPVQLVTRLDED